MNAHLRNRATGMAWLAVVISAIPISSPGAEPVNASPEGRAIAFLSREVPRWSRENHCFSCHNNGDGARALYHAVSRGYAVEDHALA